MSRFVALSGVMYLAMCSGLNAQSPQTSRFAAVKDNTLFESATGVLSNGAGSRMFCGADMLGNVKRALIEFDLSTIPPCSTIVSAELTLTMARTSSVTREVSAHRVLQEWGEGVSVAAGGQGGGGAAQPGDATWIHTMTPGQLWQNPGGDFVMVPSATVTVEESNTYTWGSTTGMVADVQAWLDDPASNHGWAMTTEEAVVTTARAFHTREAADPAERPELLVRYLLPGASVTEIGSGCAGSGATALTITASGAPALGSAAFSLTMSGGPPTPVRQFGFYLALLTAPVSLGRQCELYGDPSSYLLSVGAGAGTLTFPIPSETALAGLELSVQGVALETSPLAVATSNALTLKLGQ